jgi:hypothetical protein
LNHLERYRCELDSLMSEKFHILKLIFDTTK